MNAILKSKIREEKLKDIKSRYNVTEVDNSYVTIRKFVFMSYDLQYFYDMKARIIGKFKSFLYFLLSIFPSLCFVEELYGEY